MRGKGRFCPPRRTAPGITPAYAGKKPLASTSLLVPEDHPRLCGEKTGTTETLYRTTGSPPPMRGKGRHLDIAKSEYRITPAYAGKSACETDRRCGQ